MAISLQSMAPLKINSTVLAVKSVTMGAGVISETDRHSGNLYGTLVRVSGAEPVITAQTPFVAAYNLIGLGSLTATTLEVWTSTFTNAERQTTGSKWALTASCTAVVTITGWSVDSDGLLLANLAIAVLSVDGDTHPLTAGTGTVPTLAGQPALHTLGPLVINGTTLDGINASSGELNNEIRTYRGDGQRYAAIAGRLSGMPKLMATCRDAQQAIIDLGMLGANITGNVIQYYRTYDATTGLVGISGSTGVSITVASGRVRWDSMENNMQDLPSISIEVDGLSTSATHPFAVSTGATIP